MEAGLSTAKYDPLSEEKRRQRNYKWTSATSLITLIIFIIVLSAGNKNIPGRECGLGQAVSRGVCEDCSDSNCVSCGWDKNSC